MGKTSSATYNINYHIVWCPKYRKKVLEGKIKFTIVGGTFKMESESSMSDVYSTIPATDINGNGVSKFSLDYIKKILKASTISDTVNVSLAEESPLQAVVTNGETVTLSYIVAPRVDD